MRLSGGTVGCPVAGVDRTWLIGQLRTLQRRLEQTAETNRPSENMGQVSVIPSVYADPTTIAE
jgi:hypothetical protein